MELGLADTGATSHITIRNRLMLKIENVSVCVIIGDSKEVVCMKCSDVLINGEEGKRLLLQQVPYPLRFHKNIVCVGAGVKQDNYKVQVRGKNVSG